MSVTSEPCNEWAYLWYTETHLKFSKTLAHKRAQLSRQGRAGRSYSTCNLSLSLTSDQTVPLLLLLLGMQTYSDYHPPLHKRTSSDFHSPSCSQDGTAGPHKHNRLGSTYSAAAAASGSSSILGPKAAALQLNKPAKQTTAAAAAVPPTGAAARARAAGGHMGAAEANAPKVFYDTSSEVAAMAARVLQRRSPAPGLS